MKTLLLSFLSFVLVCFVAPAPASAQAPTQVGHLHAAGQGNIRFELSGIVELRLFGDGVLIVPDIDDFEWRAHGAGNVAVNDDGTLVVSDFHGFVRIRGQHVRGRFQSGGQGAVRMRAAGHGHALLRGLGVFTSNGSQGLWTPSGTQVQW